MSKVEVVAEDNIAAGGNAKEIVAILKAAGKQAEVEQYSNVGARGYWGKPLGGDLGKLKFSARHIGERGKVELCWQFWVDDCLVAFLTAVAQPGLKWQVLAYESRKLKCKLYELLTRKGY